MRFDRRQLLIYAVTDKAWTGKLSLKEQVEEACELPLEEAETPAAQPWFSSGKRNWIKEILRKC